MTLDDLLNLIEKRSIIVGLKCADGNIAKVAKALGMSRPGMYYLFEKHKIDVKEYIAKENQVNRDIHPSIGSSWMDHKTMMVYNALEKNGWNRTKAARDLDISIRCVRYMINLIRSRGIEIPEGKRGRST
jgi:transcriptional regulator with GAF, ATPase, and Fis domain